MTEECREFLDKLRARKIQPYQPIHLYPDFVTQHKKEGFNRRIEGIHKALDPVEGKYILDLGCSVGWNLFELVFKGATGIGVDISKDDIKIASCLAQIYEVTDKVTFVAGDVYDFIYDMDDHFDCILALNLLNHIINQKGFAEGWAWMHMMSTKCDSLITNYYEGVQQDTTNLLKYTDFKRCDTILANMPYYNNMGRKLMMLTGK